MLPDNDKVAVCPLAHTEGLDEVIEMLGVLDNETLTVEELLPQALDTFTV